MQIIFFLFLNTWIFQDSLMNKIFKRTAFIHNRNVFNVTSDQFNASLLDKIIHFLYVCLCGICFWYITFKTSKINTSALQFNIQRKRQKRGWFLVKTVPGFPEDSVILGLTHTACSPYYPWFIAVRVRLCSHCPTSLSQSPTITLKLTPAAGWASL